MMSHTALGLRKTLNLRLRRTLAHDVIPTLAPVSISDVTGRAIDPVVDERDSVERGGVIGILSLLQSQLEGEGKRAASRGSRYGAK